MTLLLGGLALVVSLVAVWLAADVQRSISNKNTDLLKSQINPIKEAIKSDRIENEKLRKEVDKSRDIIESLDEKVKYLEDTINLIEADMKVLKQPVRAKAQGKAVATGTNG
jgi:septal ring factor EnvC (AmiA/AmiB activator)